MFAYMHPGSCTLLVVPNDVICKQMVLDRCVWLLWVLLQAVTSVVRYWSGQEAETCHWNLPLLQHMDGVSKLLPLSAPQAETCHWTLPLLLHMDCFLTTPLVSSPSWNVPLLLHMDCFSTAPLVSSPKLKRATAAAHGLCFNCSPCQLPQAEACHCCSTWMLFQLPPLVSSPMLANTLTAYASNCDCSGTVRNRVNVVVIVWGSSSSTCGHPLCMDSWSQIISWSYCPQLHHISLAFLV